MGDLLPLKPLVQSVFYAVLGMLVFGLAFVILHKVTPFSIRKEIEEDHNVALAVLIGSVFLSIAIIIAAAITG